MFEQTQKRVSLKRITYTLVITLCYILFNKKNSPAEEDRNGKENAIRGAAWFILHFFVIMKL